MIIGIVGHEAAKFNEETEHATRALILELLLSPHVTGLSSGHCHLGGVDIWAEDVARLINKEAFIFPPKYLSWENGFKPRNIQIAEKSDQVHCIVVARYPSDFKGLRHEHCYHCHTDDHVKSGGCWTAKYAEKLGKKAFWHIIA